MNDKGIGQVSSAKPRTGFSRFIVGHYDISATCNLRCEGCFYFDVPEAKRSADTHTPEQWERFFAEERDHGVNFAMLAGAEPSLQLDRLRLAQRYIPNGVVYSNGVRLIPEDLRYKIHLSIWGVGTTDSELRGAPVVSRAMENYRNDRRALCVFTITALNLHDIVPATRLAWDHGLPITFNYFSPSINFSEKIRRGDGNDQQFFRISSESHNPMLSRSDFTAARLEIERAMTLFPETVLYSLHYDDWITQSDPHDIDADTGIARDCGVRITHQVHYKIDMTSDMKCGAPQTDCSTCRGYGPNYATYFLRRRSAAKLPGGVEAWYETRRIWARMFLSDTAAAGA